MTRQASDQGHPPHGGGGRRPSNRPLFVGLALSALAHLLAVVIYPFFAGVRPDRPGGLIIPAVREVGGMRVLEIVEVTPADVVDPSDPIEIEDAEAPDIAPETPDIGDEFEAYIPGRYRSAAERLRIGNGDPRLWEPIDPALVAPTPDEILRLRLAAAIEEANDSAFAEAERLAQAMDWTYTDDDGNRWGVSPGTIHLGDTEIPLGNFGFGPPPDYNGDQADWAFRMADIDRAAGTLAARMSWRERIEVMRMRREARRAREEAERERAATADPDTTSSARRRR